MQAKQSEVQPHLLPRYLLGDKYENSDQHPHHHSFYSSPHLGNSKNNHYTYSLCPLNRSRFDFIVKWSEFLWPVVCSTVWRNWQVISGLDHCLSNCQFSQHHSYIFSIRSEENLRVPPKDYSNTVHVAIHLHNIPACPWGVRRSKATTIMRFFWNYSK